MAKETMKIKLLKSTVADGERHVLKETVKKVKQKNNQGDEITVEKTVIEPKVITVKVSTARYLAAVGKAEYVDKKDAPSADLSTG